MNDNNEPPSVNLPYHLIPNLGYNSDPITTRRDRSSDRDRNDDRVSNSRYQDYTVPGSVQNLPGSYNSALHQSRPPQNIPRHHGQSQHQGQHHSLQSHAAGSQHQIPLFPGRLNHHHTEQLNQNYQNLGPNVNQQGFNHQNPGQSINNHQNPVNHQSNQGFNQAGLNKNIGSQPFQQSHQSNQMERSGPSITSERSASRERLIPSIERSGISNQNQPPVHSKAYQSQGYQSQFSDSIPQPPYPSTPPLHSIPSTHSVPSSSHSIPSNINSIPGTMKLLRNNDLPYNNQPIHENSHGSGYRSQSMSNAQSNPFNSYNQAPSSNSLNPLPRSDQNVNSNLFNNSYQGSQSSLNSFNSGFQGISSQNQGQGVHLEIPPQGPISQVHMFQGNLIHSGSRKAPPDFNSHNQSSSSLTTDNFSTRHQSLTNQQYPIDQYNRKAPKKTMQSSESRRIVSSPSMPQYNPNLPPAQDTRTKSLSSGSAKYKNTNQTSPSQGQINNATRQNSGSGSSFSLGAKSRSFTSISKLSSLSTKKHGSSSNLTGNNSTGNFQRIPSSGTISKHPSSHASSKKPIVYPAFLSEVARVFRESIILTINTKDGLEYHDTFTGKMAVDIICRIIRTNDRNLALLLGRSLDAQKFFHDVSYQHRLRDSVHEVFSFHHNYNDIEFYPEENGSNRNSASNSRHGSFIDAPTQELTSLTSTIVGQPIQEFSSMTTIVPLQTQESSSSQATGVNGVFTILTDCYSPTCTKNRLCYSIACPRRLEQQAKLNLKPQGGLRRAVSRLSLLEKKEARTLWHETVPQSILDKLDSKEKMRQELIYEFIYTERDYVKDLEFITDFYLMPLRNPANNIIPENQRETFIHTVFGGVGDLLRLAKSMSESLTRRQQMQKPVIETFADVFLEYTGAFDPFIRYSGNKVFAGFEHERQLQVNMKYARFLDAIEKKPESRKQDLASFLIKGVQRPARYQLLLTGILKNTDPESPDYPNLLRAKEDIEDVLTKINVQTGESTDRHKVMVLHRLLGKQTLESRFNFKLNYNNRILYQVTLNRKRDNEKIDLYLFEHALLLVKHKIQNKREQHKVFEKPIYLSLLFVNSGIEVPNVRTIMSHRHKMSLLSDTSIKNRIETSNYIGGSSNSNLKYQINFLGLGSNQVHASLFADDVTVQNHFLQQVYNQQKKLIEKHDMFSLTKYETRKFHGSNKINCAVPCYGGKKLLYGTDTGLWLSTVRSISMTSNEKIVSDPTLVLSKVYVTQIEELVEYSKFLVLADKTLYEFDLSICDSLDHVKNTKSGKILAHHISFFKTGICDGKLIVCGGKVGSHSIVIFEPTNPFDKNPKNKNRRIEIKEITFNSDPISISFLKTKVCVGCSKGWEILSLETGKKEPILDEADPSLDFAIQKETVTPLAIHRLDKEFMLCYSDFVFLINRNGWRISHDWFISWEGNPQNLAYFFPYILSFDQGFIEIRNLHTTNLERTLIGENIRFLHANEHEAMYACEENGYDIIVAIDFLNLKPREIK